jgi:hypothetical protein
MPTNFVVKVSIPDNVFILVIEKLLDELHGVQFYTRILSEAYSPKN